MLKAAILQEPGESRSEGQWARRSLSRALKARDLDSDEGVLGEWEKRFH